MRKWWFLVILLIVFCLRGHAQYSNLRSQRFAIGDSIRFDSIPIIEGSVIVKTPAGILPDSVFVVDHQTATLVINQKLPEDSLTIIWRHFPTSLVSTYYHKNPSLLKTQRRFEMQTQEKRRSELFGGSEINRSGSISRGFTLGNNQDVTMNSSLNLQLSGKLTDNLSVVASITDNNIPVQPEGNTQQLQEFDKIFIRVFNEKIDLILGDYNLVKPYGTFMNVNKKLQGLQIANNFELGNKENPVKVKSTLSGAVAKGRYYRQEITPIEGNQGPYKLRGAKNERFIIVIAGSESVYINNEKLQRGEQFDYTIDYNSAEVTFNPSVPITNDMRVYVEFEYTDRNYTRFMVAEYAEVQKGNTRIWANVISESDSKSQPIDLDLDNEKIELLQNIGDDLDNAVVPNITEQEFDEDFILYAKKDSVVDGQIYEVYYYSRNEDSAHYRLGFSLIGEQKGNYVESNNLANGKVYQWVAPVNGVPQGRYEPIVQLAAPESKQMVTSGIEIRHSKQSASKLEVAWSRHDINSFSDLDAQDDNGMGIDYEGTHKILGDTMKNLSVSSKYQYVSRNFNAFERYRPTEFERDWNATNMELDAVQHWAGVDLGYKQKKTITANLGAETFYVPELFQGVKGNSQISTQTKWFHLGGQLSLLNAVTDSLQSDFTRSKAQFGVPFWKLEAGLRQELEINKFYEEDDTLNNTSYEFYQYEAYIKNNKIDKLKAELSANYRKDHKSYQHQMKPLKERKGLSISTEINTNSKSTWRVVANYRQVRILNDSLIQNDLPEQHVSARLENRSTLFEGIVRSNTFYEVSTGLESKKEYAYLEVEKGQGNYVWIDRNENGSKELNEFEIAQIAAEGDHIRMYIPTDEYISVYANQFKQNFNINFRKWKVSDNNWLKFLARFSDQFTYSVNQKITDDHFATYANPFATKQEDSTLIATSQSFRNIFSFNKTNPTFGADIILNQTTNKSLLTNGFEGREIKNLELQTRWNISKHLTSLNVGSVADKSKSTAYFTENNYKIRNYKAKSTFRLQPTVKYRIEFIYKYDDKKNTKGEERAIHHDGGLTFQFSSAQKSTISAAFHYIDVQFNGDGNNSLTYELLNGLQKGANYTWELDWNRQISKSFQLSIRYNGRAGDETETIHIASMRVRAMF